MITLETFEHWWCALGSRFLCGTSASTLVCRAANVQYRKYSTGCHDVVVLKKIVWEEVIWAKFNPVFKWSLFGGFSQRIFTLDLLCANPWLKIQILVVWHKSLFWHLGQLPPPPPQWACLNIFSMGLPSWEWITERASSANLSFVPQLDPDSLPSTLWCQWVLNCVGAGRGLRALVLQVSEQLR
jgi:hypothetical protein